MTVSAFLADFQCSFGSGGPKFHYFSRYISELQFTFLFAWNCVLDRVLSMCNGTFSSTLLCSVWTLRKQRKMTETCSEKLLCIQVFYNYLLGRLGLKFLVFSGNQVRVLHISSCFL